MASARHQYFSQRLISLPNLGIGKLSASDNIYKAMLDPEREDEERQSGGGGGGVWDSFIFDFSEPLHVLVSIVNWFHSDNAVHLFLIPISMMSPIFREHTDNSTLILG